MAMGLFAGCGAGNSETSSGGTVTGGTETGVSEKEKTDGTADADEIHIWHDGDETIMQVIEDQVNDSLAEDHVTVKFEKKSGLTDQIKLYGNERRAERICICTRMIRLELLWRWACLLRSRM